MRAHTYISLHSAQTATIEQSTVWGVAHEYTRGQNGPAYGGEARHSLSNISQRLRMQKVTFQKAHDLKQKRTNRNKTAQFRFPKPDTRNKCINQPSSTNLCYKRRSRHIHPMNPICPKTPVSANSLCEAPDSDDHLRQGHTCASESLSFVGFGRAL